MDNKMSFFENDDYKNITNLINEKMGVLKKCDKFNKQYIKLYDAMDKLELLLDDIQKEEFNEIMRLFYQIEEYYFALAYSLGVKYGNDLGKL